MATYEDDHLLACAAAIGALGNRIGLYRAPPASAQCT